MEKNLTINEILKTKQFSEAKVLAGKSSLNRVVSWVHVIEVFVDIGNLINGKELILTTGVGLKNDKKLQLKYLQQLIDRNVSGLCIEMGPYFQEVSDIFLNLAEKYQFPIIVFNKSVKFVDITRDIHKLLIGLEQRLLYNLDDLSQNLQHLTLTSQGTASILKLIHKHIGAELHYFSQEGEAFYSSNSPSAIKNILSAIATIEDTCSEDDIYTSENGKTIAIHTVKFLGSPLGKLFMLFEREPTDYDVIVIEKTAAAISQSYIKKLYEQENFHQLENKWINNLLTNSNINTDKIIDSIKNHYPTVIIKKFYICIFEIGQNRDSGNKSVNILDNNYVKVYLKTVLRTLFDQYEVPVFFLFKGINIIALIINENDASVLKIRLKKIFSAINNLNKDEILSHVCFKYALGGAASDLSLVYQSYKEAKQVLQLNLTGLSSDTFYEDTGIHRLFYNLGSNNLDTFIDDYLEPVIKYDLHHKTELLETLVTYFNNNLSKCKTAKQLFIVRQTLYHRLEKLEEIIGKDFSSPEKRLAIEVALQANAYRRLLR